MHAASFRSIGYEGTYDAFDIAPPDLAGAFTRFAAEGYLGINCTIPHKEAVMQLMTRLDGSAVRCAAVNTVKIAPDGSTTGYNTDCDGFRLSLEEQGFSFSGKRIVLLGAGGAARAVAVACLTAGCASLVVANRTRAKAEKLADAIREQLSICGNDGNCGQIGSLDNISASGGMDTSEARQAALDADLVVNATSIGLNAADPSAVPPAIFRPGQTVCDIIPVRRETATLSAARAAGAKTVDGIGMLVHQGAAAFRIWTGLEPDVAAMRKAISN